MPRHQFNKIEAAAVQLATAIELYFSDDDKYVIPIHALTANALQVLEDLSKDEWYMQFSLKDNVLKYFPEEFHKKILKKFREEQNFIKHADFDKNGIINLDTAKTELMLFFATSLASTKGYSYTSLEIKQIFSIYTIWFILNYAEKSDVDALGENIKVLFKLILNSRSDFYKMANIVYSSITEQIKNFVDNNSEQIRTLFDEIARHVHTSNGIKQ